MLAICATPNIAARSSSDVEELDGIDILVNNAHQATFKDIREISDEEWQLTFEVNIHAMFYLTKAAVPHMKPGSAIINTASINSDMPNPILPAYATTKGAVQNLAALRKCRQERYSCECRGAGADLDTIDPVDDAGGCREEFLANRFRCGGQGNRRNWQRPMSCWPTRGRATRPELPSLSPAASHSSRP